MTSLLHACCRVISSPGAFLALLAHLYERLGLSLLFPFASHHAVAESHLRISLGVVLWGQAHQFEVEMPNGSAVPRRLGFLSAVASSSSGIDQPLAANSSQASGPTRVILAPVVLQRVVTDLATWLELGSSCERPSAVVALERAGMEQPQSNGLQVTINKSHVRYYLARPFSTSSHLDLAGSPRCEHRW